MSIVKGATYHVISERGVRAIVFTVKTDKDIELLTKLGQIARLEAVPKVRFRYWGQR